MKTWMIVFCLLLIFSLFSGGCARHQPEPATGGEYVCIAERGSDVFHRTPCLHVRKIKDVDKVHFSTEEDAKASGRQLCEECAQEDKSSSK
jgi:hypothetical protein